jgi:hypothetical protein
MGLFGLALGHPDPTKRAEIKPRLPQSVVLHRERYDPTAEAAALPAYDRLLAAFSADNGMGAADWSDRVIDRLGTVQSLRGRDRMRAALHGLGFRLR